MRAVTAQRDSGEFIRVVASADPTTSDGVRELLERAGLNPSHYSIPSIVKDVKYYVKQQKYEVEDGNLAQPYLAADFFEMVFEHDKSTSGLASDSLGPNLYENNPGDYWPPVWIP